MNKQEFIAAVAAKAGSSLADAGRAVNAVFDVIQETLQAGGDITLTGFGKFETRTRAARNGVNPLTKQPIKIAATKVPAFKAGKGLKDAINK